MATEPLSFLRFRRFAQPRICPQIRPQCIDTPGSGNRMRRSVLSRLVLPGLHRDRHQCELHQIGRAAQNDKFYVMDAAQMTFPLDAFDDAVTISTTHHLDDVQLGAMIAKAVLVARKLHVIDAILPLSSNAYFKRAWFRMDRGRFARTFDDLQNIVSRSARIECHEAVTGPLHDVCYIGATR